mmetsp:Transcript_11740/g.37315  ORF Transcript_11740/g.37315 Transcript_11740/m.37315 type:complete len:401 (+) Transcript_11740:164-1366(+)
MRPTRRFERPGFNCRGARYPPDITPCSIVVPGVRLGWLLGEGPGSGAARARACGGSSHGVSGVRTGGKRHPGPRGPFKSRDETSPPGPGGDDHRGACKVTGGSLLVSHDVTLAGVQREPGHASPRCRCRNRQECRVSRAPRAMQRDLHQAVFLACSGSSPRLVPNAPPLALSSCRLANTRVRAPQGGSLPPMDQKPGLTQTEDILNSILPPREWTEDGQLWVQYVSSTPATRLDVINLQEKLDQQLQQRQARETGICPVREELYAQCFDELIRQVTINCAERGLLLLRVRDEMRMTIAAYQTLYESSVAFGMRKALQTEQGKADMEARIQQLEGENKELERLVHEWKMKCEMIEKRETERRAQEEKKHSEEVAYLTKYGKQLKNQLDTFLAPQKGGAAPK